VKVLHKNVIDRLIHIRRHVPIAPVGDFDSLAIHTGKPTRSRLKRCSYAINVVGPGQFTLPS
jgi:hypothetical protein